MAMLSIYPMDDKVKILDMSHAVVGLVFPALIPRVNTPMDATIRDPSKGDTTRTACDCSRHHCMGGGTAFALRMANVHLRPPLELNGT